MAAGVALDSVDDYVAVNLELVDPDLEHHNFFNAPKDFLHSLMRAAVVGWHPALRRLIDDVSPDTIAARTIRMLPRPAPGRRAT